MLILKIYSYRKLTWKHLSKSFCKKLIRKMQYLTNKHVCCLKRDCALRYHHLASYIEEDWGCKSPAALVRGVRRERAPARQPPSPAAFMTWAPSGALLGFLWRVCSSACSIWCIIGPSRHLPSSPSGKQELLHSHRRSARGFFPPFTPRALPVCRRQVDSNEHNDMLPLKNTLPL